MSRPVPAFETGRRSRRAAGMRAFMDGRAPGAPHPITPIFKPEGGTVD